MKFSSLLFTLTVISLFIFGCDNPSDSNSENEITEKELTYSIVEYDNSAKKNPIVQVTYNNLANDLVVDTVQVPWTKSFDYHSSINSEEVKTNLIVQYQGEEDVALKASIDAEKGAQQSNIGSSFLLKLVGTIQLSN